MKKIVLASFVLLFGVENVSGQVRGDTLAAFYSKGISIDTLKKHLMIIASDEFEGRETGKVGQKKAAEYLAGYFEDYGLEAVADSGFFQRFHVSESLIQEAMMNAGDTALFFLKAFYFFNAAVNFLVFQVQFAFPG